jgi:hypothetical protein
VDSVVPAIIKDFFSDGSHTVCKISSGDYTANIPLCAQVSTPLTDNLLQVIIPSQIKSGIVDTMTPKAIAKLHIIPKLDPRKVPVIVDTLHLSAQKPCRFRLLNSPKILQLMHNTNTKLIASVDLKLAFHAIPVPTEVGF